MGLDVHEYFQCVHSIPAETVADAPYYFVAVAKRHATVLAEHVDVVWRTFDGEVSNGNRRDLSLEVADSDSGRYSGEYAAFYQEAEDYYSALADCPSLGTLTLPLDMSGSTFSCVRLLPSDSMFEVSAPFRVSAADSGAKQEVEIQFAMYFEDSEEHDEDEHHDEPHRALSLSYNPNRALQEDAHADHEEEEEEIHYDDIISFRSAATGDEVSFVNFVSSEEEIGDEHNDEHRNDSTTPIVAALIVNLATLVGVVFMVPTARALAGGGSTSPVVKISYDSAAATTTDIVKCAETLEKICTLGDKDESDCCSASNSAPSNLHSAGAHDHFSILNDIGAFTPFVLLCFSSFSSGCILATALYLVIPEAMHMIETAGYEEGVNNAHWGSFILAGILFPYASSFIIDRLFFSGSSSSSTSDISIATTRRRVICGCLVGDAFHNLADGAFIAASFVHCSHSFGWTVVFSTIYHELAQEAADFFILTGPGALPPALALGLNFVSGTTCIWGAMIVVYLTISDLAIGYILCFGGGIYIQVGAAESYHRVVSLATTFKLKLLAVFLFFLGALPIGVVLMNHSHCEAVEGEAVEHASH